MKTAALAMLLVASLVVAGCGSGAPAKPGRIIDRPATRGDVFALKGDLSTNGRNGFYGDRALKGGSGMQLGCHAGRQYAYAVTVNNTSDKTVTLTGVRVPDPAPNIVHPVAIQLRLAPPPSAGDMPLIVLRQWSATPGHRVNVPPGRGAVVQPNFLVRQCHGVDHGSNVAVPGALTLRYEISGKAGTQRVVQSGAKVILAEGPTIRPCASVPGSVAIAVSDISCAQARAAAPACHRMNHGNYGTNCSIARHRWYCDLKSVHVQVCWRGPGENAHWYRVRWEPKNH